MMPCFTIILGGGSGSRMHLETPKQFMLLQGLPILMHSIVAFNNFNNQMKLILVLPAEHVLTWGELCTTYNFNIKHEIIIGGKTRYESVKNGLKAIQDECLIAVHDGVRPLVSQQTIRKCFTLALEKGTAIPVADSTDSLRIITETGNKTLDRTQIKTVATPQVFHSEILRKAYSQEENPAFTDCAAYVENLSYKINLTENNRENIKITYPTDLKIAEILYQQIHTNTL